MEINKNDEITAIVNDIFDRKEDVERKAAAEKALENAQVTIEELAGSVEAKDSELADLNAKLEEMQSKADGSCDCASTVESLEQKVVDAEKKAEEFEGTIVTLGKMSMASQRADELVSEGLSTSREKAYDDTIGMSDEDFTSFKSTLIDLRDNMIESLKKLAEQGAGAGEETTPVEEASVADDTTSVPAADVSAGREVAAINPEIRTTSVQDRYKSAGEAIASRLAARRAVGANS